MLRLALLVALALAVAYLVEAAVRRVRRELGAPASRERIRSAGGPAVELVACAACGVHTPAARALWSGKTGLGKAGPFCSEACRQRAKAAS